jgi:hypothetical protein
VLLLSLSEVLLIERLVWLGGPDGRGGRRGRCISYVSHYESTGRQNQRREEPEKKGPVPRGETGD